MNAKRQESSVTQSPVISSTFHRRLTDEQIQKHERYLLQRLRKIYCAYRGIGKKYEYFKPLE
jgi:hypothetical protein